MFLLLNIIFFCSGILIITYYRIILLFMLFVDFGKLVEERDSFSSLGHWWDIGKVQIKMFCQCFVFVVLLTVLEPLKRK